MKRMPLILMASWPLSAAARPKADASLVQKVPSIEDVVQSEGFMPTPSQSEVYAPGSVLVPNALGGHDKVVSDCIDAEIEVAIMSQSSIATSLSAGVSARLAAARGGVAAGVEKRLSFVDPEQRTIPLAKLMPTPACTEGVQRAAGLQDLSRAIVVHDVLVARIQNTVCTKADASGAVVMLGAAEASSFSECVQESDAQVPLGFKAVPLSKVLSMANGADQTSAMLGTPVDATSNVSFGTLGGLGVESKLREQRCDEEAKSRGGAARASRLAAAEQEARTKASVAWQGIVGELDKCTQLKLADRGDCIRATEEWLRIARAMPVNLPAGVEPVATECGDRQPAFAAESRTVAAVELGAAEAMLGRLRAADAVVVSVSPGGSGVSSAIRALRSDPGSSEWDREVKGILLGAFDGNRSGSINSASELSSIGCDVFQTLETMFDKSSQYTSAMTVVYGFAPGYGWVGASVGFDESLRESSFARWTSCLEGGGSSSVASSGSSVVSALRALRTERGSSEWDREVKGILVAAYDGNRSGSINTSSEVSAIGCDVIRTLEAEFDTSPSYSSAMQVVYGFHPNYGWVGSSVGFDQSVRQEANTHWTMCMDGSAPSGTPASASDLVVGARVKRGPDWKWDDQDGGAGRLGTVVIAPTSSDWARVEWDAGGANTYRWGHDGKHDLAIVSGASSSGGAGASSVIRAIAATPWTGEAGGARQHILPILVGAYDSNGSGTIDTSSEVQNIPCDVVVALADRYRKGGHFSSPMRAVFGFEAGYGWVGGSLGFDEKVRVQMDSRMTGCGLD